LPPCSLAQGSNWAPLRDPCGQNWKKPKEHDDSEQESFHHKVEARSGVNLKRNRIGFHFEQEEAPCASHGGAFTLRLSPRLPAPPPAFFPASPTPQDHIFGVCSSSVPSGFQVDVQLDLARLSAQPPLARAVGLVPARFLTHQLFPAIQSAPVAGVHAKEGSRRSACGSDLFPCAEPVHHSHIPEHFLAAQRGWL
jgi:hypothetical protein